MSKKDKACLDHEDEIFNDLLDLLLSDYLLAIDLFHKWKDKISNKFKKYKSDLVISKIEAYITEKELLFEDALNNIPEYNHYLNA